MHLKEIDDLEVFYTDFTEIRYRRGLAKAQLMPIIDHRSKLAAGHALGESADKIFKREGQIILLKC